MRLSFALFLATAFAALTFTSAAQAATYEAFSFSEAHHSAWLPDLDQRHLHFEPGAALDVANERWTLSGDLVSATDGSSWSLEVVFEDILTGDEFGVLTGYDNARLKGTTWANQHDDWMFAREVRGTITANTGDHAGTSFELRRMPGSGDYLAQFGTCLNDKNCGVGLSTWITLKDPQTEQTYRGDININVSQPVPEPSAALVFGLGTVVAGTFVRRR